MEFLCADISRLQFQDNQLLQDGWTFVHLLIRTEQDVGEVIVDFGEPVDVVIMNPPFGTKNKGMDMIFLQKAIEISTKAVYSLHKTSTRSFVLKKAQQFGAEGKVLAELQFDLPKVYRCHKQQSVDVHVDFIRFEILNR
eukprot:TRINITY_DN6388_c0_g2_i1.p1 TRINITY_DN6388_c0_g2~~TRINITY_DN6388_c0_g2_i1.p1  ORF type:complete len:139 (+),score=28.58 TRINITY_DN6388_c0_g2_i1:399-815(+)